MKECFELNFSNEDGPIFHKEADKRACKLFRLSSGEYVALHKKHLYHFDANQRLINTLFFDKGIREDDSIKLMDESILFVDNAKSKRKKGGTKVYGTLMIYNTEIKNLSLTIKDATECDQYIVKILELRNGNLLIRNIRDKMRCYNRKGELMFSYTASRGKCDKCKSFVSTNFVAREIGENKLLCLSNMCHYSIINLETLECTIHPIDTTSMDARFNSDDFDPILTCFKFIDFYIMSDHTFWIIFEIIGSNDAILFLYDLKLRQVILQKECIKTSYYEPYLRIKENVFLRSEDNRSFFLDGRGNTLGNTNFHCEANVIMYADQHFMIVYDYKDRIFLHKLYCRFDICIKFYNFHD
jgi:hypothetical protein